MPVGSAVTILTKIPWGEILASVPSILAGIKNLMRNSKTKAPALGELKLSDLEERINEIESFEKEQSELVVNIGNQINTVATAIQIVSKRVNYFLILSLLALIIGLVSLVLVLTK